MLHIVDGGIRYKLSTVTESNSFFMHAELSNSEPIHAVQFQKDWSEILQSDRRQAFF